MSLFRVFYHLHMSLIFYFSIFVDIVSLFRVFYYVHMYTLFCFSIFRSVLSPAYTLIFSFFYFYHTVPLFVFFSVFHWNYTLLISTFIIPCTHFRVFHLYIWHPIYFTFPIFMICLSLSLGLALPF